MLGPYEAFNKNGKRIQTQFSPKTITQVTKMLEANCPVDEIIRVTGVSFGSIRYVASLDPIDTEVDE